MKWYETDEAVALRKQFELDQLLEKIISDDLVTACNVMWYSVEATWNNETDIVTLSIVEFGDLDDRDDWSGTFTINYRDQVITKERLERDIESKIKYFLTKEFRLIQNQLEKSKVIDRVLSV